MKETTYDDEEGSGSHKRRTAILDMTYGIFILIAGAGTLFCAWQYQAFYKTWLIGLVYLMGLTAIILLVRFMFKSSLRLTSWHEGAIVVVLIVFAWFIMNDQNQTLFRNTFHTPFTLTPLGLVGSTGQISLDLNSMLIIFGIFAVIVVAYSARKLKVVEF